MSSLAIEIGLVAALLLLYRGGRTLARGHVAEAEHNAAWVWHLERTLRVPSEASVQHVLLATSWLVRAADSYYVGVHFPITIAFLLWLWWRHHDRYARVRTTLAITTGVALLVMAFVPLAPPRLFSGDGLLDTMQTYGPSAYSTNTTAGLANQFAAMPSLHIAWSVLIAVTVVLVSTRRWRWVVVAHPVVTTVVVVATANHYWADGLVAVVILATTAALVYHPPRFACSLGRCCAQVLRAAGETRWLAPVPHAATATTPAREVRVLDRAQRDRHMTEWDRLAPVSLDSAETDETPDDGAVRDVRQKADSERRPAVVAHEESGRLDQRRIVGRGERSAHAGMDRGEKDVHERRSREHSVRQPEQGPEPPAGSTDGVEDSVVDQSERQPDHEVRRVSQQFRLTSVICGRGTEEEREVHAREPHLAARAQDSRQQERPGETTRQCPPETHASSFPCSARAA